MNLHDFLTHLSSEPAWLHAGAVTPLTRASNGDTPLHAAIWARDDEAARQLIDAGADVNAAGEDGYTPIHAALAQSNVALARRLDGVRRLVGRRQQVCLLGPGCGAPLRRSGGARAPRTGGGGQPVARPNRPLPARVRASQRSVDGSRASLPAPRVRPPARGRPGGAPRQTSRGRGLRSSRRRCLRGADGRLRSRRRVLLYGAIRASGRRAAARRCFPWSTAFQRFFAAGSAASASRSSTTSSAPGRRCEARSPISSPVAPRRSPWRRSPSLVPSAGELAARHNLALETLASFPFTMWTPAECPLCRAGVGLQNMPAGNA